MNHTINHWLTAETDTIVLQRDNAFAMLTWRDFNQPAAPLFTPRMALGLFAFTTGLPLFILS